MTVEWKDPPPPYSNHRGKFLAFLEELKTQPGRWALYPDFKSGSGSGLKHRHPGLDVTTRTRGDGTYDVYLRWVGEQS